jgi:hypothetical protein
MSTKHTGYTPGPWETKDGRTIQTPSGTFYLAYFTDKATSAPSFQNFAELDRNAYLCADAPRLADENAKLRALLSDAHACIVSQEHGGRDSWGETEFERTTVRAARAALSTQGGAK